MARRTASGTTGSNRKIVRGPQGLTYTKDSYQRMIEGARRGGQNSHINDKPAKRNKK